MIESGTFGMQEAVAFAAGFDASAAVPGHAPRNELLGGLLLLIRP